MLAIFCLVVQFEISLEIIFLRIHPLAFKTVSCLYIPQSWLVCNYKYLEVASTKEEEEGGGEEEAV